jgi:NAD(P)-dependent dehydrogenase (short-subunit alcohol dehydrogenase family)
MIAIRRARPADAAAIGAVHVATWRSAYAGVLPDDYLASRGGPGLLADIPLGRVATPQEIAAIITFCALDAPPSMTGAVIDANGASFVR